MLSRKTYGQRIAPMAAALFLAYFADTSIKLLTFTQFIEEFELHGFFATKIALFFLISAAYTLPFLLLFLPAGFLADRYPKRYVMLISEVLEILLLLIGFQMIRYEQSWGTWPLAVLFFLTSVPTVFFTASYFSNLPEQFPEKELSAANGRSGAAALWGAACGIIFLWGFRLFYPDEDACWIMLLLVTVLCTILCVIHTEPVVSALQIDRTLKCKGNEFFTRGFRAVFLQKDVLLASAGENFFLALGAVLELTLVIFARYTLNDNGDVLEIISLQLAPVIGVGLGCLLAGKLSKEKIELGLIPFGAAGVAICLTLAAFFPGGLVWFGLKLPGAGNFYFHLHPGALFFLLCTGLSGSLVAIPLRSYIQHRVQSHVCGAAIVLNKAISYALILLFSGIALLLCIKVKISPVAIISGMGILTFLVTLFSMWLLPEFTLRFLVISLGNTIYRMNVKNASVIPERGPAILLANHVTFIDEILISACTSRPIRFLLNEEYYQFGLLARLANLTGFIRVPRRNMKQKIAAMFQEINETLDDGGIICIFPEGGLTHNGIIGKFSKLYQKLLDNHKDLPLIPVHVGNLWGSRFSMYFHDRWNRTKHKNLYPVSITFGSPLPHTVTPFEARRRITELAAETAIEHIPDNVILHDMVIRHAKRHPFKTLVRDFDGNGHSRFGFVREAALLSREVRRAVPPDCPRIGVLLPNSCASAMTLLAILFADKTPVPLNPTTANSVFEDSIRQAGLTCIITSRFYLKKLNMPSRKEFRFLEDMRFVIPQWKRVMYTIAFFLIPPMELTNMLAPVSHRNSSGLGVVLFSSGSTGKPKGVMLTQRNLCSNADATALFVQFNESTNVMGNLPLFHSFGFNVCFWMPLMSGGCVTYVSNPLDSEIICKSLKRWSVTHLFVTPSFLQTYLRKMQTDQTFTLKFVGAGAEKLRSDVAEKFKKLSNDRLEVTELYGCTELSPIVSFNLPPDVKDTGEKVGKENAIGLPLPDVCCRVVDPVSLQPVAANTEGILYVKGPNVMSGYLKAPELTAKVLNNGYYATGDVAKMDEDGCLTISGRLSRFSKIAGEMVPHEMVERIINELFPGKSRTVAVCGIPDARKGEALLVLYKKDMPLTPDEVVERLRDMSISNLWIPKTANFEEVDDLPLLGSGKLDMNLLRRKADEIAARRANG